jgi:hypothetical protein
LAIGSCAVRPSSRSKAAPCWSASIPRCTAGLPAPTVNGDMPRKAATYAHRASVRSSDRLTVRVRGRSDTTPTPIGSACALRRDALIRIRRAVRPPLKGASYAPIAVNAALGGLPRRTARRPPRGRVHSRSRRAITVADCNVTTPHRRLVADLKNSVSWVRRLLRRGRPAAAGLIRGCRARFLRGVARVRAGPRCPWRG